MVFNKKHTEATKLKQSLVKMGCNNPNWVPLEKIKNGNEQARRIYRCPYGKEIHHKDGNPKNNEPSNIEFLTRTAHMIKDGRLERLRIDCVKAHKKLYPIKCPLCTNRLKTEQTLVTHLAWHHKHEDLVKLYHLENDKLRFKPRIDIVFALTGVLAINYRNWAKYPKREHTDGETK